jgi:hypothetical protein
MNQGPMATNEALRLTALHRLQILDTPPEPAFDRIAGIAQEVFRVPVALVSLIDESRQWFKAKCGLDVPGTPRDQAFCTHTILHDTVFVVEDARANPTFAGNPLVVGPPFIRFYAGAPLTVAPGIRLGSLCIIDSEPRTFDPDDVRRLAGLAQIVVGELWLRELGQGRADKNGMSSPVPYDLPGAHFLGGAQIRAARGLLDWSINRLAELSGVSANTIKRFEASTANLKASTPTVRAVRLTLEDRGIVFLGQDVATAGVRRTRINPS